MTSRGYLYLMYLLVIYTRNVPMTYLKTPALL